MFLASNLFAASETSVVLPQPIGDVGSEHPLVTADSSTDVVLILTVIKRGSYESSTESHLQVTRQVLLLLDREIVNLTFCLPLDSVGPALRDSFWSTFNVHTTRPRLRWETLMVDATQSRDSATEVKPESELSQDSHGCNTEVLIQACHYQNFSGL